MKLSNCSNRSEKKHATLTTKMSRGLLTSRVKNPIWSLAGNILHRNKRFRCIEYSESHSILCKKIPEPIRQNEPMVRQNQQPNPKTKQEKKIANAFSESHK